MSRNYWTLNKEGMKNRLSKAQAAYENALENVENLHVKDSTSVATYRTNGILTRCARLLASIRIPSSWRSRRCSMCVTSILMTETSFLRTCTSYSADGLVSIWTTDTDSRRRILYSRAERLLRKEHVCVPETAQSV